MPGLRQLSGRDLLRIFAAFNFRVVVIRGSHAKLRRVLSDGQRQTLTVPMHKTLAAGTLRAIFRQALRYIPEADLKPWFFSE
jgi:predicted RNA binding protein YcfA (HicA-like mRNA interferase family)